MLSPQHIADRTRVNGSQRYIYRSYGGHQYHRFRCAILWAGTVAYVATLTMSHIVNKLRCI